MYIQISASLTSSTKTINLGHVWFVVGNVKSNINLHQKNSIVNLSVNIRLQFLIFNQQTKHALESHPKKEHLGNTKGLTAILILFFSFLILSLSLISCKNLEVRCRISRKENDCIMLCYPR